MSEKYPSPKEAIFGNGHVANLRCAGKYILWHGTYLLLSLVLLIATVLWKAFSVLGRAVGRVVPGQRVTNGANRAIESVHEGIERIRDSTLFKKAFEWLLILAFVAFIVAGIMVVVAFLWYAYTNFWQAITILAWIVGASVAVIGGLIGIIFLIEVVTRSAKKGVDTTTSALEGTGQKIAETPGVRRIYSECPVHFDIEPKWFEAIFDRLFDSDEE